MYKKINFSLWCDYLERNFLEGEFINLIQDNIINGITSNPSIFKEAFLNSKAYKETKNKYKSKNSKELYEILATQDIKIAAEKLLKNYSSNNDGFVSIEVNPKLKNNANATYKEGKRLYQLIKMPNVMIKIPATKAGFVAMKKLISEGINVNATLVFSSSQVSKCLEAFKIGSKKFKKRFPNSILPKGVISVFVSRFDRKLDDKLKQNNLQPARYGIMNAMLAYIMVEEAKLENVRVLFASTGVKDNSLPSDYYVKELLLPRAINTAPLSTIKSFISQKHEVKTIPSKEEINKYFLSAKKVGINYQSVCNKLLKDGLKSFEVSFMEIINKIK